MSAQGSRTVRNGRRWQQVGQLFGNLADFAPVCFPDAARVAAALVRLARARARASAAQPIAALGLRSSFSVFVQTRVSQPWNYWRLGRMTLLWGSSWSLPTRCQQHPSPNTRCQDNQNTSRHVKCPLVGVGAKSPPAENGLDCSGVSKHRAPGHLKGRTQLCPEHWQRVQGGRARME